MSDLEVPDLALSMIQPMGTALVRGWKPIENRKWKPWAKVIGKLIAIHASAKWDVDYLAFIYKLRGTTAGIQKYESEASAIIGVARVIGCVSNAQELAASNLSDRDIAWFTGPYGWLMMDAREIDPIPCKGALALWRIPPNHREVLAERLGAKAA